MVPMRGHPSTRREFFAQSAVIAASVCTTRPRQTLAINPRSTKPLGALAPSLMAPEQLRQIARTAIDAAVHAGAQFADVRVAERRSYAQMGLTDRVRVALRVRVADREAAALLGDASPEHIMAAARDAVATARTLGNLPPALPLVSMPVVTGEWRAPVSIDPFAISPNDHEFVRESFDLGGIPYTRLTRSRVVSTVCQFEWHAETRVFASSEGSMVTQYLAGAIPAIWLLRSAWRSEPLSGESVYVRAPGLFPMTAGFEAVIGAAPRARFEAAINEASEYGSYPMGVMDVGRHPIVFDGMLSASLIGNALLPALTLSRVLGYDANMEGVSFLPPPTSSNAPPSLSRHLSLDVAPETPHWGAARWDDEGVVTQPVRLIDQGTIVEYLSTRGTGGAVAEWQAAQHRPAAVPGVAFTFDTPLPRGLAPATVVAPAPAGPSLPDLLPQMSDGLFAWGGGVAVDEYGLGGTIFGGLLLEVRRGRIVREIAASRIEFSTLTLLRNITMLGGPASSQTSEVVVDGGIPWGRASISVAAPALGFKEVNVMSNRY